MRDDERRRLEEIWTRYLAREPITLEERAGLVSALERDEVFLRRLLHDLQIEGALRAAAEIEQGQEDVVATVKALVTAAGRTEEVVAAVRKQLEVKMAARATAVRMASSRRVPRVLAAGVLLAGAAGLAVLLPRLNRSPEPGPTASGGDGTPLPAPGWRQRPSGLGEATGSGERAPAGPRARTAIARLEAMEGAAYRHGPDGTRRAAPSLEVGVGDWVATSGPAARARLSSPSGSRIEMTGDTVAGLSADAAEPTRAGVVRLFVAHGRATAVVPAGSGSPALVLASPHAIVTGTGTLALEVGTSVTRVKVKEGRARVSALGVQRGTDVLAGQLALVSAEDLQPPRAQNAVREALLLTGPDDTKEEPAPAGAIRGSEERLKARLERLGFTVSVADAGALPADRARAAALLVLSSSVSTRQLGPSFADLPVPMLVLESTAFEKLGLTGARWRRDVGPAAPLTELMITDATHPLAAGLNGTVRVLNAPLNLRWAAPPPGANVIATYAGAPEQASLLFSYERGAQTAGVVAPARRVGLFLGNGKVIRGLTDQGWRLFDAAALWAATE